MFTKSGGSRNYFQTAIRRTEIHSVVKQSLLSFSFSLYLSISLVLSFSLLPSEEFRKNEREEEREHTRERTLSARSFHRYRSLAAAVSSSSSSSSSLRPPLSSHLFYRRFPDLCPLHRQTFSSTGKRRDRVSLHFAKP